MLLAYGNASEASQAKHHGKVIQAYQQISWQNSFLMTAGVVICTLIMWKLPVYQYSIVQ